MTKVLITALVLVISVFPAKTQHTVSGIVYDKHTHEPIAFANLLGYETHCGTSSNIEGKFTLNCSLPVTVLKVSCVGYKTDSFGIKTGTHQKIYLEKSTVELDEVVVFPGVNPADVLMQKVYENRNINNPEKNSSFTYHNYNKLIVTLVPDSSFVIHPQKIESLDSGSQKAFEFFKSQHLFLSESVTERKFIPPDKNHERVIASKVSGFQNPVFNLLATQFQSFTFYKDYITIGPVEYESPVTRNSSRRYFFLIEDTLMNGKDTVFVVSFRPGKGEHFKSMKGKLFINTNGYALQNVIAEPNEVSPNAITIRIQQKYELVNGKQWFPRELNTVIDFNKTISIDHFHVVGYSYGYIEKIGLEPGLRKKDFSDVEVTMDESAGKRDDAFWTHSRVDSLDEKEIKTYRVIDSIGKAQKLDKKMNRIGYLLSGKWPVGFVNIDLDKIILYNSYEGTRLGMGLHTNKKISKHFDVGGYGAWGFKDRGFKYGGDMGIFISEKKQALIRFSYKNDLAESGHTLFPDQQFSFAAPDIRYFFANRFDRAEVWDVTICTRAFRHFKFFLSGNSQFRKSFSDYEFVVPQGENVSLLQHEYRVTELSFSTRFQFREKFTETPFGMISGGSIFPVFRLKLSTGITGVLDGEINYRKIDLQIEKRHRIRRFGFFEYRLEAGKVESDVPYGLLYNAPASYKMFTLYATRSFETMRINEFFSDTYAAGFLVYEFPGFFPGKKFNPRLALVTNAAAGTLKKPELHRNVEIKTLEKGFIESGVLINQLLKMNFSSFGIGFFYRYGANRLPEEADNWAVKFSFGYAL